MVSPKKKIDKLSVAFTIYNSNSIFKLKKLVEFYRDYYGDPKLTESDLLCNFALERMLKEYDLLLTTNNV